MELKVKVASVSNSPLGNRIQLKLDDSSTAHEKAMFIEKKRNSDAVDLTIDDPENLIKQGDTFVLALIKRTEEPLPYVDPAPASEPVTDENPNSPKDSPEGEEKPE